MHRSGSGAGVFRAECTDGRRVLRDGPAQVAHAVGAGRSFVRARIWQFGTHADLRAQNGTECKRECPDLEQERRFRRHRRLWMHVGCRVRGYLSGAQFLTQGTALAECGKSGEIRLLKRVCEKPSALIAPCGRGSVTQSMLSRDRRERLIVVFTRTLMRVLTEPRP
jgi:hypothetical protein